MTTDKELESILKEIEALEEEFKKNEDLLELMPSAVDHGDNEQVEDPIQEVFKVQSEIQHRSEKLVQRFHLELNHQTEIEMKISFKGAEFDVKTLDGELIISFESGSVFRIPIESGPAKKVA